MQRDVMAGRWCAHVQLLVHSSGSTVQNEWSTVGRKSDTTMHLDNGSLASRA